MSTEANKAARAAIIKFKADNLELSYSYSGKLWHARLYRHAVTPEQLAAELTRRGFAADAAVTMAQATAARNAVAERSIATGSGATVEEAILALKATE